MDQERSGRTSRAKKSARGSEPRKGEPQSEKSVFSRMISVATGRSEETEPEVDDAVEMLKQDHEKVKTLFSEYEDAQESAPRRRKEIVDQISMELEVHAQLEEKIFYQAFRQVAEKEPKKLVRESFEEHKIVKTLVAELAQMQPKEEQFDAKVTVLKESLEHHVKEEEGELFPAAKKLLGDERLQELGAEMRDLKEELQQKIGIA